MSDVAKTYRIGSLFSGIGGFEQAAERLGMQVLYQSEIDPFACKVLAKRFPSVPNLGDITKIGGRTLPYTDIIVGGSPCQGFSIAGLREGLADGRSGLFAEFIRVVKEAQPEFVLFENVPGLLTCHGGRDFAAVLGAFRYAGALDICWRILDSQWFGVAQRRRRLFIVADFRGQRAGEILFEPEGSVRDTPPRRPTWEDVASAAAAGTGERRGAGVVGHDIAHSLRASQRGVDEPTGTTYIVEAYQCHGSNVGPMGTLRAGSGGVTSGVPFVTIPAITSHYGKGTDSDATDGMVVILDVDARNGALDDVTIPLQDNPTSLNAQPLLIHPDPAYALAAGRGGSKFGSGRDGQDTFIVTHALTAEGHDASEDGTGRGTPLVVVGDTAATLTGANGAASNSGGRRREDDENLIISGLRVRRLLPVECERLQAFPDQWTMVDEKTKDSPRYRALGNAVTTSVIWWILNRLQAVTTEGVS